MDNQPLRFGWHYLVSDMNRFYGVLMNGSILSKMVWDQIQPFLIATLEVSPRAWDVDSLRNALEEKAMQLWVSYDDRGCTGFCITQIAVLPNKKTCQVLFGGGIFAAEWREFLHIIENWAIAQGCHSTEVHGRRGWNKVFQSSGYAEAYCVLEKNLEDLQQSYH